ncbi:potassium channel family protein [soil metagenome]|jgi:voltage-gated potassium channel
MAAETDPPAPAGVPIQLPRAELRPLAALVRRVLMAFGLILAVAVVVLLDRGGYVDDAGGRISFLDAVYYASVTVTTTGYGDITPVTDRARLLTTLLVTPARILFLLLLVGTTVELLTERWREAFRRNRWRSAVRDHYIICGYGTKGRSAARALREDGIERDRIVVVERNRDAAEEAAAAGYTVVIGDASRVAVLRQASIERACAVVVAPHKDDAAVLTTLTARELNPDATIVSAVREDENAHLLRQSGADSVITSSEASGRLLGLATRNPRLVQVVEDLLNSGEGLALAERECSSEEVGRPVADVPGQLTVGVVRGGEMLRFDDPRARLLEAGDRVVGLWTRGGPRRPG